VAAIRFIWLKSSYLTHYSLSSITLNLLTQVAVTQEAVKAGLMSLLHAEELPRAVEEAIRAAVVATKEVEEATRVVEEATRAVEEALLLTLDGKVSVFLACWGFFCPCYVRLGDGTLSSLS